MNIDLKLPDIRIYTVAQFVEHVVKMNNDKESPIAFRGQRYYGWPTKPKIFREDSSVYNNENHAVRDIVSIHPSEFETDKTMFDRLVRMQHFGLATRLVDVTSNPLVALWFATERSSEKDKHHGGVQALYIPKDRQRYYDSDRVSCIANIANLKLVQKRNLFRHVDNRMPLQEFNKTEEAKMLAFYVGQEKTNFQPIINPSDLVLPVYVRPKMSNKRIIAQSGAFLLYGSQKRSGRAKEGLVKSKRVWIHEEDKPDIRRDLQMLGIHESILFPEIDRTAKFISERYSSESQKSNPGSLL